MRNWIIIIIIIIIILSINLHQNNSTLQNHVMANT